MNFPKCITLSLAVVVLAGAASAAQTPEELLRRRNAPAPEPSADASQPVQESVVEMSIQTAKAIDPDVVYRFVPAVEGQRLGQRVAPIDKADLRPKSVYYRFSPTLGRHVWSVLAEDGQFYFAMGEGSTLRTDLFDIVLTADERASILDAMAPRLKQKLEEPDRVTNINLYLRLDHRNEWRLQRDTLTAKVQSVYDLETGHRWEWHGKRRHAVLHSTGDMWTSVNGRYLPVATAVVGATSFRCRPPAGSIRNVVRTAPLAR